MILGLKNKVILIVTFFIVTFVNASPPAGGPPQPSLIPVPPPIPIDGVLPILFILAMAYGLVVLKKYSLIKK